MYIRSGRSKRYGKVQGFPEVLKYPGGLQGQEGVGGLEV